MGRAGSGGNEKGKAVARNREIEIFNMSLLDILSGALGAFCFLMITLFPHYMASQMNPGASQSQQLQKELDQARQELEQLKSRRPAPAQGTEGLALDKQKLQRELEEALARKAALMKSGQKGNILGGGSNTLILDLAWPMYGVVVTMQSPAGWTYTSQADPAVRRSSDSHETVFEGGGGAYILVPNAPPGQYRIYGQAVGAVRNADPQRPLMMGGNAASVGGLINLPTKAPPNGPGQRLYYTLMLGPDGRIILY